MQTQEYLKTYNVMKRKYDEAIVLVKADEQYITFKEDAQLVAEVLRTKFELTETAIPTCFATINCLELDRSITLLVKKGFRVAVCDDIE